jgi:DNA mismatch endonuclease, patch repair protein
MADVFTKKKRSDVMSRIRAKNTKPELLVRTFLFSKGFRYRLHQSSLPGKPDIILKKYRTVIFVNGCFWHGHTISSCKIARFPKSNVKFWRDKIVYNQKRHKKNLSLLKKDGWKVLTIWECQLRGKKASKSLCTLVNKILQSNL